MRGRGRGRERGSYGGRQDGRGDDRMKRSVFTKLMKDENAEIRDIYQARRFLEGMETFHSKAELLAKLEDHRENGTRRIRDVLSFINSTHDVESLLIPMLKQVMNEETNRPLVQPLRNRILLAIYHTPSLFEVLVEKHVMGEFCPVSAESFCSFLRALTKPFIEVRQSEDVKALAKDLRERGDVGEARILCTFLLLDNTEQNIQDAKQESVKENYKHRTAACWVSDMEPPGGRHDNDQVSYRDIRIVPTVEELICEVKSYLPLASGENNFIENKVTALLDRNFRLLREDAVSSMKSNLAECETKSWKNARIIDLNVSTRRPKFSVSLVIQFESRHGTSANWKKSRALMQGSVMALCRGGRPVRMGTITVRDETAVGEWLNDPCGPKIGVLFESDVEYRDAIHEMAMNCTWNEKLSSLLTECGKLGRNDPRRRSLEDDINVCFSKMETYDLVEVSKSFFAYQPILKTLQEMEAVPFSDELVGSNISASTRPAYLPDEILLPKKDFGGVRVDLRNLCSNEIVQKTSLDKSQAEALNHSLTSRVVLIQGPPGTGKTFMGALVARVIRENTDESILCVCYTNHALDQFLLHMLDAGEKRIVRIGGRSKSERLAGYQLKALSKGKSSNERFSQQRVKQVHARLFNLKEQIEEEVKVLKTPVSWKEPSGGICAFLELEEPEVLEFLRLPEAGDYDFQIVGPKGKKLENDFLWNCWLKGDKFPPWLLPHMSFVQADYRDFQAFWDMKRIERTEKIAEWRQDILKNRTYDLTDMIEEFHAVANEEQSLCRQSESEILQQARIIGATTSGAAAYHDLLTSKAAGVVLVEEAGEVLESHILTSLACGADGIGGSSKHLILIGDHKQLPPKVENYELTKTSGGGYNLDCSLFERLVLAGIPSVTLEVQHRMRPSISALIRTQTYPSLRDHESVTFFPEIKGTSENLLFINHNVPEDGADTEDSTTKSNLYEADMGIEIVRFLLLQGYGTDQIVVLTPYLGQLLLIMTKMKSIKDIEALVGDRDMEELEVIDSASVEGRVKSGETNRSQEGRKGVRCSSIDNYQGEEADVVVVSLVRSNKRGNIGFLKEPQRVNVLLSRARHGMFIVGNAATLLSSRNGSAVWQPILDQLSSAGRVLDGLPATCQLHPNDEPVMLRAPHDFRCKRPNGGCLRPCRYRLSCGHVCPLMCHPTDRNHEVAERNCSEPCRRIPPECKLNHSCSKLCKEKCGPCHTTVGPILLTCGHHAETARCHEVRSQEAIDLLSQKCCKEVTFKFECGHETQTTCANSRSEKPQCPHLCGALASCGHLCRNECGSCTGRHDCQQICSRALFCGHPCGRLCHAPAKCQPCKKPCHSKCPHSFCPKDCSFPCSSCVEPCQWQCSHQGWCPLVCGAPCARLPCNERCTKKLKCGHQCPSVCGEDCPAVVYCQECGTEKHLTQIVDMINLSSYAEHDVYDDPMIFLPCGHFFNVSTMDGIIELDKVYEKDDTGRFTGLKPLRGNDVNEKSKQCPECRSIIHSIRRYGRLLRLVELRGLERKHMAMSDQALRTIEKRIKEKKTLPMQMMRHLNQLENMIRKSPMHAVFEACGGSDLVESPMPPVKQLIRCLELRGSACDLYARNLNDDHYHEAVRSYMTAMQVADHSTSRKSGAQLRLSLARLILKYCNDVCAVRDEVNSLLDWILSESGVQNNDKVVVDAGNLKDELSCKDSLETIKSVIAAMSVVSGYNYGGSASDHWYECPNGHPYFIGECGGAMQESTCPECGAVIGGTSHQLHGSNRQATGTVAQALSSN